MGIPYDTQKLVVAGDDVVFWIPKAKKPDLDALFYNFFSQTTDDPNPHGFGQCVKTYTVGEWHEFEFCSKWSLYTGDNWYLTWDASKLIFQKQVYVKNN